MVLPPGNREVCQVIKESSRGCKPGRRMHPVIFSPRPDIDFSINGKRKKA
jgi:hypothetical protein